MGSVAYLGDVMMKSGIWTSFPHIAFDLASYARSLDMNKLR